MDNYVVYKHTTPVGKVYIGITGRNPLRRWRNGKGYYQNKYFTAAINKYGWENITHEIIAEHLSFEKAASIEQALIKEYHANDRAFGYNQSNGGEAPAKGSKWSASSKKKNSIAHKGKTFTDEHRRHISEGKKGQPNGREGQFGKDCSQSGLLFMIDETTGNIVRQFYGYDEMKRETGFARTPVLEAANGKRKRAYGYLWSYQRRRQNVFV